MIIVREGGLYAGSGNRPIHTLVAALDNVEGECFRSRGGAPVRTLPPPALVGRSPRHRNVHSERAPLRLSVLNFAQSAPRLPDSTASGPPALRSTAQEC